jgi:hypothetical protein
MTQRHATRAAVLATALWGLTGALTTAETITGTFKYQDSRGPRPVAEAKVEIRRFAPSFLLLWTWTTTTTMTDANGVINVPFKFAVPGVVYEVKVFATNRGAVVLPNGVNMPGLTPPFHQQPGEPDGAPMQLKAQNQYDVLDFSYTFSDSWTPQHFNIADTILLGFKYADARRDPAEKDALSPVTVQPTSVTPTGTWYNAPVDTIVLNTSQAFDDYVILHEYGHAIEAKISRLAWIPATHFGCAAMIGSQLVNSPEHAWMEGFADFFAMAVARTLPAGRLEFVGMPIVLGTLPVGTLESPPSCGVATPDSVENFVAASLWDLVDAAGEKSGLPWDSSSFFEPHDVIQAMDTEVFQIVDHELGALGSWPTIHDFRRAWIGRGLAAGPLEAILRRHGILPPAAPIGYLDGMDANGDVRGWTLDPDSGASSTVAHFYVDGPYGTGTFAGAVNASVPRGDVNQQTGYPGNHGFKFNIPTKYRDGKTHSLYAYGIDVTGTKSAPLAYSPLNFAVGLPMWITIVPPKKDESKPAETLTVFAYDANTGAVLSGDVLIDDIKAGVTGSAITYTWASLENCDPKWKPPCRYISSYPVFTITVPGYTPIQFVR